jgi:septal ring factor EnvC (AmiA/AmiB activator)
VVLALLVHVTHSSSLWYCHLLWYVACLQIKQLQSELDQARRAAAEATEAASAQAQALQQCQQKLQQHAANSEAVFDSERKEYKTRIDQLQQQLAVRQQQQQSQQQQQQQRSTKATAAAASEKHWFRRLLFCF